MTSLPSGPAAEFATKPVLIGEKALLRPFTADDTPDMAVILEDEEVRRFTGGSGAPAFDERRLREWYGSRCAQPDRLDLAVVDRANGALVGEVVLYEWDEPNRSCAFRTLLGPRGRDRGLGTEAIRLIVGHGFERLGLHRISLGGLRVQPPGPPGVREGRLCHRGSGTRSAAARGRVDRRRADVPAGPGVGGAPRPSVTPGAAAS